MHLTYGSKSATAKCYTPNTINIILIKQIILLLDTSIKQCLETNFSMKPENLTNYKPLKLHETKEICLIQNVIEYDSKLMETN
jgi:hypothetical protein